MSGIMGTTAFVVIWVGFMALMIICMGLLLLWAVRSRQFQDQDRARYLPLMSGIPDADEKPGKE